MCVKRAIVCGSWDHIGEASYKFVRAVIKCDARALVPHRRDQKDATGTTKKLFKHGVFNLHVLFRRRENICYVSRLLPETGTRNVHSCTRSNVFCLVLETASEFKAFTAAGDLCGSRKCLWNSFQSCTVYERIRAFNVPRLGAGLANQVFTPKNLELILDETVANFPFNFIR